MSPPRPQEDDDGATTIRTGPASGLNSDFVTSSMYIGDSLPEGLRLGEYEILSVIGEGGFGIVYLAYDHFLQRQVALKEYMPSSLAGRSRMGLEVTIKSERHRDTFHAGLKSFINEARLLAQFDHRALVKVYRFWEGNGTAYMVMPYVVGPTLKAALAEMPTAPSEDWLRGQVLTPLMEALALLHKASCLHRDIAPDNILLTETGPMLLDFGAARKVIGDLNQTLTVVLKPGYAPIEQYGEVAALTQGPWTDVYALGGVVRYAITGKVPVSATTRLVQDTMVPMAQLAAGQYSEAFLQAVDAALAVKPADRPQDMAQLAAWLGEGEASASAAGPVTLPGGLPLPAAGFPPPASPRTGWPQAGAPSSATTQPVTQARTSPGPATIPGAATRPWPTTVQPAADTVASAPAASAATASPAVAAAPSAVTGGNKRWLVLVAALFVVVAGVVAWLVFPKPGPAAGTSAAPAAAGEGNAPASTAAILPTPPIAPAATSSAPSLTSPQPVPAEPATTATASHSVPASAIPGAAREASATAPTAPAAAVAPPVSTTRPQAPAPARPASPAPVADAAPARPSTTTTPARPAPAGGDKARCSELLQKASLEPLTPSETSFLKTECK